MVQATVLVRLYSLLFRRSNYLLAHVLGVTIYQGSSVYMYAYIEVFETELVLVFIIQGEVYAQHSYRTWDALIAAHWFDDAPSIPVHISPKHMR